MNTTPFSTATFGVKWEALAISVALSAALLAQGKQVIEPQPSAQTAMDLPSDFHKYYGQAVNKWKDSERKIAKLDVDADLNYDGTINNSDPSDGGAFEGTPPGLVIGVGEMSRTIIRIIPYRLDFRGEVVVTAEIAGINRADKSGEFSSLDEEVASTGRVRVWADAAQKQLVLDSKDPSKRFHEWVVDEQGYPANLPGIYPRFLYIEGVKPSPKFTGDLRLLITVSHRDHGATRETYPQYRQKAVKAFRTTFDHMLLTVTSEPHPKVFINNNIEGAWVQASNPTN